MIVAQQEKDSVNVALRVSNQDSRECLEFKPGAPETLEGPGYPMAAKAARISGPVKIEVELNESGQPMRILKSEGPQALQEAAREAALRSRFKPSLCDGKPTVVNAVIVFNFVLFQLQDEYTVPTNADGFKDIDRNSPFYEAIVTITDNYKLGFGYADGGFHPNAPITKGDFAHFLFLSLELLNSKAKDSNKLPKEIDLFRSLNPGQVKSADEVNDFRRLKPYARSVSFLISKYDIALVDEEKRFRGNLPLKRSEVLRYWRLIFGEEAVPVNFKMTDEKDKIMTRGEFALFLHESLFVLTYKVLP